MNVPSGPRLSPIPPYRKSPDDPLPQSKVLAIGINYRSRPDELKGPVNDAKNVKRTLEDVYHYRETDTTLMTDEDENRDTELWPSAENILRAIDNLVGGASRGDVFVFYFAGHCGQHDNGEYQYIIACDDRNIMGNTLRERLIGPLPTGSRLTVILDACHSGAFLGLGPYLCQRCLPRQRAQSLSVPPTKRTELLRRNTEDVWRVQILPSPPFLSLPRRRFKKAITTTLAVIRLRNLMEKKSNEEDEDDVVQPTTSTSGQHLLCGRCNRAYDSTKAPKIIFLPAGRKDQQAWEDTKKRGKGMTTKLLKILTEEPSIKLGDLEQRLNLFKQAFKRVRMATGAFRSLSALVSPKRKAKLENKYKARGVFDFKEQNAQVGSLRPVGPDEPFLLPRAYGEDDEG